MIGLGTLVNIVTIVLGTGLGVLIGSRLSPKTSQTVTDSLGLIVLVLAALNLQSLTDEAWIARVTSVAAFFIVMFAVLFGGILGSLLKIDERVESFGGALQKRFAGGEAGESARARFILGFVNASLLFAIGPMSILGSMSDGMGQGSETLIIKSILDFFAAIAFAASLGWGVAFSAISVGLWQGGLTALAFFAGAFVAAEYIAAITATGGILLMGIALRLLNLRQVAVANLLPALVLAPLFTWLVAVVLPTFG
jgi:uncharacterized membrane protein YqgA involved in biofilm formation